MAKVELEGKLTSEFTSMGATVQVHKRSPRNGPLTWIVKLDFTQNPRKVMDDITFVRSHWWLVSEGFSLSTVNSDVQKLPATLYHRIADFLAYAA